MILPHPTDTMDLMQLKLSLANLQVYLARDLTRPQFERASQELKRIWKDWNELEIQEVPCPSSACSKP